MNWLTRRRWAMIASLCFSCGALADQPAVSQPTPAETVLNCDACQEAGPAPAVPTFPGITGDWFGARTTLAEHGLGFRGDFTQYYRGLASGGVDKGNTYGGKINYFVDLDGEKAGLWRGFFVNLHAETRFGESGNTTTGTLLPTNTQMRFPTDAGTHTDITGLKFTQALSESFVVFAGKLNTLDLDNLRFAGGQGGSAFMNGGLAFNTLPLRAIPYSTLGAGAAFLKDGEPLLSVTVMDAIDSATESGFETFLDKGVVIAGEGTIPYQILGQAGHIGLGGVYSTRRYVDLDASRYVLIPTATGLKVQPSRQTGSWAIYYKADQALWTSEENPKVAWGLFSQGGIADGNPSFVRSYFSGGIGGNNPLRPQDTFGVGYFYLGVSNSLKQTLSQAKVTLGDEQGVELFYNYSPTTWFHITPDVQYIMPTRSAVGDSWGFGVRARVDF